MHGRNITSQNLRLQCRNFYFYNHRALACELTYLKLTSKCSLFTLNYVYPLVLIFNGQFNYTSIHNYH